jgi:hypothetical protein
VLTFNNENKKTTNIAQNAVVLIPRKEVKKMEYKHIVVMIVKEDSEMKEGMLTVMKCGMNMCSINKRLESW